MTGDFGKFYDDDDDPAISHYVAEAAESRKLGRRTLSNTRLKGDRDTVMWILSQNWSDVGWQLTHAGNVKELSDSFRPLYSHPDRHLFNLFFEPNARLVKAEEIRDIKKRLRSVYDLRSQATAKHSDSLKAFQEVELACQIARETLGLKDREQKVVASEYQRRKAALEDAKRSEERYLGDERKLEGELDQKGAAFAQAELLDFIAQKRYARNPFGFANAMAGLPEMKWRQSHTRCTKLKCETWPTLEYTKFLTIEKTWKLRHSHPGLAVVDLFRAEIAELPRTVETEIGDWPHARLKKVRIPNPLRVQFADDFMFLRIAIEEVLDTNPLPQRVPFLIASRFSANRGKGRTALQSVLAYSERIE